MAYLTLEINCNEDEADILSALMLEMEFKGTSFENNVLIAYSTSLNTELESLETVLHAMNLHIDRKHITEEQNWNELWESNFHDLEVGEIHVRAPFHESLNKKYEIIIHPKMAFGTGHHGTTQLMLKAMQHVNFQNKEVLDMGCGSGILSIHASQLGAHEVLAIDYDSNSTVNCKENVQLNQVANVSIKQADNLDSVTKRFDIILSNIVKNINFSLVPSYVDRLNQDGRLILCGLLETDLKEAQAFAKALNLTIVSSDTQAEWLQLTLKHSI